MGCDSPYCIIQATITGRRIPAKKVNVVEANVYTCAIKERVGIRSVLLIIVINAGRNNTNKEKTVIIKCMTFAVDHEYVTRCMPVRLVMSSKSEVL